ncbi:hypothetical protein WJX81_001906 [Elliptochloris bilobata]|uniref:Threonylcarbamoyl-AMP synthase n=1 Tax=Elliptochloris bilobata TaxID=381761 RepID=A0AAW1SLC7_9CHLO
MAEGGALQAVVTSLPAGDKLTIAVTLAGRQRFMDRPKAELLERTLFRLQMNAAKPEKRKKQGPGAKSTLVAVSLLDGAQGGAAVPGDTPNAEAWCSGHTLRVGDELFHVVVNPPSVLKVEVHGLPMVGYPLCPYVALQFADEDACRWRWLALGPCAAGLGSAVGPAGDTGAPGGAGAGEAAAWQEVATARVYTPAECDVGAQLRVEVTPVARSSGRGETAGVAATAVVGPVGRGPADPPAAARHAATRDPLAPPGLRVVTYNILADQYAATDYAQRVLFGYCPAQWLAPEYRRPLIVQEVLGYDADVVCLQEVDESAFRLCLQPHMEAAGFAGHYTNKAGRTREGSATFFRRARLRLVRRTDVAMKELFAPLAAPATGHAAPPGEARHARFAPMLRESPALAAALQKVATIAQLTVLAPVDAAARDGPLCVVNTHLFFHPRAPHIRTMHTAALLAEAGALIDEVAGAPALRGRRPALLFCGDLNSDINDGVPGAVELLQSGRLPADHWDWTMGAGFSFAPEEDEPAASPDPAGAPAAASTAGGAAATEGAGGLGGAGNGGAVHGVDLEHGFRLASVDSLATPFTNYVRGYSGLLDYVWHEPGRMAVRRVLPQPPAKELAGWLPSERRPSDHLAVVADLDPTPAGAPGAAAAAAAALAAGGVVAVPTDTLYGLACDAASAAAVATVYAVKGRAATMPLAVCVAEPGAVSALAETGHLPQGLLAALLPGPVTLLLSRRADAPLCAELNPGVATIGVRVPDSAFLAEVCRRHGGALALTSANPSGGASSVAVDEFDELWPRSPAVMAAIDIRTRNDLRQHSAAESRSLTHRASLLLKNGQAAGLVVQGRLVALEWGAAQHGSGWAPQTAATEAGEWRLQDSAEGRRLLRAQHVAAPVSVKRQASPSPIRRGIERFRRTRLARAAAAAAAADAAAADAATPLPDKLSAPAILLEQASLGIAQDSGREDGVWSAGPGEAQWLAGGQPARTQSSSATPVSSAPWAATPPLDKQQRRQLRNAPC